MIKIYFKFFQDFFFNNLLIFIIIYLKKNFIFYLKNRYMDILYNKKTLFWLDRYYTPAR